MRRLVVSVVLLLCVGQVSAEMVTLPRQQRGDMTARLSVEVLEPVSTPGLAEVRCTLIVEGGPMLEVEPATLGAATAVWKMTAKRFSKREGDRQTVTEVLELRQVEAGQVPLPSIKVRFRDGAEAAWEKAEWVDILKPTLALTPEGDVEPAARVVPWWLWPAVAGGVLLLLLALAGLLAASRPRKPAPPTPEQWALEELGRLDGQVQGQSSEWYHTRLSYIVRRFLEEKHGLRAPRQTTTEFLQSVRQAPQLSEEQRELLRQFLERCDLAKFAPVQVSQDDCRQTTGLARTLVQGTEDAQRKNGRPSV